MAICVNGLGRQLASSRHLASAKRLAVFVRRKLAGYIMMSLKDLEMRFSYETACPAHQPLDQAH